MIKFCRHRLPDVALYQVHRATTTRGLDEAQVKSLVETYTEGYQFGILGDTHVDILLLNLALDGYSRSHLERDSFVLDGLQ